MDRAAAPVLAPDERKRLGLAATLFGLTVVVQLMAIIARHVPDMISIFLLLPITAPAAAIALLFQRGRRMRVAPIVYALLWGAFSVWGSTVLMKTAADMALMLNQKVNIPDWFVPLVTARSIAFAAATIVLVLGRPSKGRRIAGAAIGCVFAALFVGEHIYQAFGSLTR
jgi:hypothetical protein